MVNRQDPAQALLDYSALVKINHVVAGLYIWETMLTIDFEMDVLRRKRPYKWTIWLYLGTRYTGLLAFVCMFFFLDVHGVPCQSFIKAFFALGYASWASASFIITLRVIAIWDFNGIVSLIAFVVLSGGVALNIRRLVMAAGAYNPIVDSCVILHTHTALINAIGVLTVDVVLLLAMLIGLLRHRNSVGIWKLLYQQCIIWIALALIAEIPVVAFLILNLNDAWNEMLVGTALAILSIAAARMYRSLSDRGSFTEYVYKSQVDNLNRRPQSRSQSHSPPPFRSSDPPQFPSVALKPTVQGRRGNVHDAMPFSSFMQLEGTQGTRTTYGDPVFPGLPTGQVQVEVVRIVPGGSVSSFAHESTENKPNSAAHEIV